MDLLEKEKNNLQANKEGCRGCATLLFILIIAGVIFNFAFCGKNDKKQEKEKDMQTIVVSITKQEVEKRLKSPKSAKFPWDYKEYNIEEIDSDTEGCKRYCVSSYVDADNSFGAKIRVNYIATFDINEEDKYRVIECVLLE